MLCPFIHEFSSFGCKFPPLPGGLGSCSGDARKVAPKNYKLETRSFLSDDVPQEDPISVDFPDSCGVRRHFDVSVREREKGRER